MSKVPSSGSVVMGKLNISFDTQLFVYGPNQTRSQFLTSPVGRDNGSTFSEDRRDVTSLATIGHDTNTVIPSQNADQFLTVH